MASAQALEELPSFFSVVLGEARVVLAALRRNKRFSYYFTSPFRTADAHPLVDEIKSLRRLIYSTQPPSTSPESLLDLLDPFLKVVRSKDTSGLITGAALLAVERLTTQLLALAAHSPSSRPYAPVFTAVLNAVAACRFDASDPAADEVVLARILAVLSKCVVSHAGLILSDAAILRAFESCMAIAGGKRRSSELLRRAAGTVLTEMASSLSRRVTELETPDQQQIEAALRGDNENLRGVLAGELSRSLNGETHNGGGSNGESSSKYNFVERERLSEHGPATILCLRSILKVACSLADPTISGSEYDCMLGQSVLTAILQAGGRSLNSRDSHSSGLLKQILLYMAAPAVIHSVSRFSSPPSLVALAFESAIALIYALGDSAGALVITLFRRVFPQYISGVEGKQPEEIRDLKADDLERSKIIDATVREIGLEALCELVANTELLAAVYAMSDCEPEVPDTVEPLLRWLGGVAILQHKAADLFALSEDEESAQVQAEELAVLCSEALIASVNSIWARTGRGLSTRDEKSITHILGSSSGKEIIEAVGKRRQARLRKAVYVKAVDAFERAKVSDASSAIQFLKNRGICGNVGRMSGVSENDVPKSSEAELELDIKCLVAFFRQCPGVNKKKIGIVLGEPDAKSQRVLKLYTSTFNFTGRTFTDSLRIFLESFRLPGEAQKNERILEAFAHHYYNQNKSSTDEQNTGKCGQKTDLKADQGVDSDQAQTKSSSLLRKDIRESVGRENASHSPAGVFTTADAVFIMSFAVVMLNTDQHSSSVKKKMTVDDFIRNNRGINDGKDFPRWFLADTFDSIAKHEIRITDEAKISELTSTEWSRILENMSRPLPDAYQARLHEEDVFRILWRSAVVGASLLFQEATDANEAQNALEGFLSIVRCSSAFRLSDPIDAVISTLTSATGLLEGSLHGVTSRFGRSIKSQMASVTLLGVSREYGNWVRTKGWRALVSYVLRLHALGLLPDSLEKEVGSYGPDLLTPEGSPLPPSPLVPSWWPSQRARGDDTGSSGSRAAHKTEATRKFSKANGILAAFLGVSLGSESESDEESHFVGGSGKSSKIFSSSPPSYLKMNTPEDVEAQDLARKCVAQCNVEDVFAVSDAKGLGMEALQCLAQAFARAAHKVLDGGDLDVLSSSKGAGPSGRKASSTSTSANTSSYGPRSDIQGTAEVAAPAANENAKPGKETSFEPALEPRSPLLDSSAVIGTSVVQNISSMALESGKPATVSPLASKDERKARASIAAFCVNAMTCFTLKNRDNPQYTWPPLLTLLIRILSSRAVATPLLHTAVVSLLRISVRLLNCEEIRDDILRSLHLLIKLPERTGTTLSVPIMCGIYHSLRLHGFWIRSTPGWHAILSIIEAASKHSSPADSVGLKTLETILSSIDFGNNDEQSNPVTAPETFPPLLDTICAYTSSNSVHISISALELLHVLSQRITSRRIVSWAVYWGPLLRGLGEGAQDPRGKVRNHALQVFERVVATGGSDEFLRASEWKLAFDTVLMPLMNKIFTTNGMLEATAEAERAAQRALHLSSRRRPRDTYFMKAGHDSALMRGVRAACSRTRLRTVALISKTFLQHHGTIAKELSRDEFAKLWSEILDVFRLAWTSAEGEGGELQEHIPENAKNIILVLLTNGIIGKDDEGLWKATVEGVKEILPGLEDMIHMATETDSSAKQEVADSGERRVSGGEDGHHLNGKVTEMNSQGEDDVNKRGEDVTVKKLVCT